MRGAARKLIALVACSLAAPHSAAAQVFTEPAKPPRAASKPARLQPKARPVRRVEARGQEVRARRSFSDPAAYCAGNPEADAIGAAYVGTPAPDWLAAAAAPAKRDAASGFTWRCMGGRVFACSDDGGNAECAKADAGTEPGDALRQHCASNGRQPIPAALVRNRVPVWTCRDGMPAITGYRSGLDPRGYFSAWWRDVTDYAPANMVGAVSKLFVGKWSTVLKGKGFIFKIPYLVSVEMEGGPLNARVGSVDYFASDLAGQVTLFCSADLYLRSADPSGLQLEERLSRTGADGRCPVQGRVTMRPSDGQLLVEWRKPLDKDAKVRMSGWMQRPR